MSTATDRAGVVDGKKRLRMAAVPTAIADAGHAAVPSLPSPRRRLELHRPGEVVELPTATALRSIPS
jgi:hypothetical protein